MKIIITMAGQGNRFKKIGFTCPKHEIVAQNRSLFELSLLSLKDFFDEEFLFIVRKNNYKEQFIEEKCKIIGISRYKIIEIDQLTAGQAETALCADKFISLTDSVVIYNIDTYVEEYYIKKSDIKPTCDGFIPAFNADGDKWSFVLLDENNKVIDVAEKERISNLGTIGLYYFKTWNEYKKIYKEYWYEVQKKYTEIYIAPFYKYMIEKGQSICASIIPEEKIHCLGTPEDILQFDPSYINENVKRIDQEEMKK